MATTDKLVVVQPKQGIGGGQELGVEDDLDPVRSRNSILKYVVVGLYYEVFDLLLKS